MNDSAIHTYHSFWVVVVLVRLCGDSAAVVVSR